MALTFECIAVVGANGPTGRSLVGELLRRGFPVRAVSRSMDHLQALFPVSQIDKRAGDAMTYASLSRALEGCDLLVDCIGLPSRRMADHPVTARNIARWLGQAGGRCVQVSSYWSYLPLRQLPLSERHPRRDGPPWVRIRRETEDILREVGSAIVHLPDFFGPHVHASTLQNALVEAVQGRPMNWLGAADTERDYIYVPDAMQLVAELLQQEQAYADDWILPGCGPLSGNGLAALLGEILEREVRLRAAPPWLLRIVSLFNAELRGLMQIVPEYVKPIVYDGAKFERLIGNFPRTSYPDALRATIASISEAASTG